MSRLLACLALLCLPLAGLAEFTASVDRNQLNMNETLGLVLRADRQIDTQALDLTPLSRDFEILSSSPQSTLSIVNGRQSAETRWVITLLPRRAGTLTIPAFDLNGERTAPIQVEVTQASQAAGDTPLSVELDLSKQQIYVNEELTLTISLISSIQVSNLSGEQLQIANAEVSLLGQRSYNRVINGENWQVNEWTYAVFARSPGQLQITPQTFSGVLGGTGRSFFDPFASSGRRILARTETRTVQVVAPPASTPDWLPAREVNIEVVWDGNPNDLAVGEPLTRTIVTTAVGQQASALPPLTTAASPDYRVYANQPSLNDQPSAAGLRAERRDSAAIVPARAGEIRFPEIRLRWWDIDNDTWQEALVPEEVISVAPANAATATPPAPGSAAESEPPTLAPAPANNSPSWPLWALLALSLMLGLDNLRLRRGRHRLTAPAAAQTGKPSTESRWQAVIKAADKGTPMSIRTALINWADQRWPEQAPHNLHSLRINATPELLAQLRALEASLSDTTAAPIDRAALRTALAEWHKALAVRAKPGKAALPELYPG